MDKTEIQVLLIEDNPVDVVFLREALEQDALNSFDLTVVERLSSATETLRNNSFDIILLDLGLPDVQGLEAFTSIHEFEPQIPKVILSGLTNETLALQAVHAGAQDYLVKGTAGFSAAARAIRHAIERQKGQTALHASEERYRYLFENNPHPMWAYDLKTLEFLAVNDAAVDKYGYTRDEFLHMTIVDIRPNEDVERLKDHIQQPRPNLQHSGEWRHKLKDGSIIAVDISSHTLTLSGRESALVVAQDITERTQAEAAVHASEERFRAMIENGLDDISLLDVNGNLIWESPAVVRNLGYVENAFVGRNIFEIVHPDDRTWTSDLYTKLIQKPGERQEGIFRLQSSDGSWRWVEAIVSNMLDNPSVQAIVVNYRDITERKMAEEELRSTHEFLQGVQNALSAHIAILDGSGKIVQVNSAWRKFADENGLGDPHYGVGMNYLNICDSATDPDSAEAPLTAKFIRQVLAGQVDHAQIEYSCHSPQEQRWFILQITSFQDSNQRFAVLAHENITERKKIEDALKETSEQFRTLFEASPEAIMIVDPHGDWNILDCNATSCAMNGYTRAELIGQSVDIFNLTPGNPTARAEYLEKVRTAGVLHYETSHRRKDGTIFPIEVSTSLITLGGREVVLGIDRDITARKQGEEKIRESEARFASIFHTNPARVSITSFETGQFLDVNEAFLEASGYAREEVLGHTSKELNDWFDPQARLSFRTLLSENGHVHNFETKLRHKSGKLLDTLLSAEMVELFGQRCILSVGLDITERKQIENDLRISEERFHQLADNIQEVFWITDAITGEDLYISPAGESIWGYSIEALIQTPDLFMNTILPEDRPTMLRTIENQRNGQRTEVEYRIMKPDGSILWIWDRAFPIFDDSGKVIRLAGIAADITERKQSEKALRESEVRFAGVVNSAMDAVISVDSEQRIVLFNPAAEKMFGCKTSEAVGQQIERFIPTRYRSQHKEHILRFGQTGNTSRTMGHLNALNGLRSDGTEFPVEASISHTEAGGQHLYTVILRDITERKQAENALHKNEQRLRIALAATNIAVFHQDLDLRYTWMYQPQLGYTSDQVVGRTDADLLPPQDAPRIMEVKRRAMETKRRERAEVAVHSNDQTTYYDLIVEPLLDNQNTIIGITGSTLDITEHKQVEIKTQRHLVELEALYENGLAVGRLLDPHQIGEQIIETFSRYLSWHHVTIRLKETEGDNLYLIAFNQEGLKVSEINDIQALLNSSISKVGQGLSGWVVQTGQPLRTGNVHLQPRYVDTYPNIQSGLYMPLKIGDMCIGVISVESDDPDAFSEQDERLLATLANQATIAFENARLYQSAQQELLERKRMETELRVSETHYRELADSITDIFFELDHDLHYSHWNKASELLTGVSAENAIGRSMHEIFGESNEQARTEKIYKDVLINRRSRIFETPFIVNGQIRSFEVNAYPSTHGVSVVAKDVTDRKRSEAIMQKRFELMEYGAQHALEELMQKTIEEVCNLTGSVIGFFHLVDADQATPDLQIWPAATLAAFNVPVSEGQHRSVEQAGVWADAVRLRRSIIHNDYMSLPNKKTLPTGHAPIMRELVIPIIRNEKILAVLGVGNKPADYAQQDLEIAERFVDYAWDITERKQMEAELAEERNQLAQRVEERTIDLSRANSNLARALRVKDEFLANMSHELRTPLNAILGLSESLAEQTAGPLNEKQQKYITTVSESGHHLLSLINDILDLAKIEAGQIKLDVNKVDTHAVCDASLRMIKQLARKKNQNVSLEVDQRLSLMWADERRLKQMLVNLLSNAVKFTPEGGKLGLEVHGDEEQNKVTFTIWDTGIGIKESDLPRLFKPFVQLDAGLARESSGTGLGLALVAQMAQMHGGSVSVTSQPGQGSRFSIMLPWEPALAVDTMERLKSTGKFRPIKFNPGQKPTILLVEDTEEVVMMVSDYLEMNGFKTVVAHDGVEGIIQAQLVHPDLILMDIQMPRMDGFETAQKLRSEPEFKHTPIIALTALAMPNDRERCLAAGMNEYITKPVHLRGLIKIIQNFLVGEQEVRPQ